MDAVMTLAKPGEYWGQLLDFPEYLIGAHGAVMSLKGGKVRILKPIKMGAYRGVQITDQMGALRKRYVHRLVAEVIHGPCPSGQECRHLDGTRSNNDFTNLQWGTHSENERDKGHRVTNAKLTQADAETIRRLRNTGLKVADIAGVFGVTVTTVYRIIRNEAWRTK